MVRCWERKRGLVEGAGARASGSVLGRALVEGQQDRLQAAIDILPVKVREETAPSIIPPQPAFGRDDDLVAPALDGLADDNLAAAKAIGRRGVDEIDTEIDHLLNRADGFRVVSVLSPELAAAEHPGAQADDGGGNAGVAERFVVHDSCCCRSLARPPRKIQASVWMGKFFPKKLRSESRWRWHGQLACLDAV